MRKGPAYHTGARRPLPCHLRQPEEETIAYLADCAATYAWRFWKTFGGDLDNLTSAALYGVVRARKLWKEGRKAGFNTYATSWYMKNVWEEFRKGQPVKRQTFKTLKEAALELIQEEQAVGNELRLADALAMLMPAAYLPPDHLDRQVEEDLTLADFIQCEAPGAESTAVDRVDWDYVWELVALLPDDHRRVIEGLYVRGLTLKALAKDLSLPEARVRALEQDALATLRLIYD